MAASVLESQNQLRLSNTGCDVIFEIGAKSFPAHRVVLMARMEYFRNMFTADMTEKSVIQFDPLIINPTDFDDVLNYVYTSKIDFTNENIRAVYKAADYFCFDELTNKVEEHIEMTKTIDNVGLYKTIAVEFGLKPLDGLLTRFIFRRIIFSDINKLSRTKFIPALSFEDLVQIMQKLEESERFEDMFHYSVDWILNDEVNRSGMLLELLKKIPLKNLSYDFLKQVASQNDLIRRDNRCLSLVFDTFITVSDSRLKEANNFYADKLNTVINKPQIDRLYVIGGRDGEALSSVSQYNDITQEWTATTPMPSSRSDFGCAVIGHKVYVCGGRNGDRKLEEMTEFDTHTQTWTQLTPMKHARSCCAAAVLNEHIYVAGGGDRNISFSMVERYSVQADRWEYAASMTTKRQGLGLVALNGFLYAIGGFDDDDVLNTVERYDPQTDQWTAMNNTNNPYQTFGSAVLNGNIYIVGKDKCEVYSPAEDKWTEMPAPKRCGNGRRLAAYDGKLYAIGGRIGEWKHSKGLKTVDVYDFRARVWRPEMDMDVARCYHWIAVVKQ